MKKTTVLIALLLAILILHPYTISAQLTADTSMCEYQEWTWPHDSGHMWELILPHLPSKALDFKRLKRMEFHGSSCSSVG